jgi:GxxExxY protein
MEMQFGCAMWAEEQLNRISEEIIGAAIDVHRRVGPDCLESAYSPCFALELARRKLDFRREAALPLKYGDIVIPRAYFADYIVEDAVVVELKAASRMLEEYRRQLLTYLKVSGYPLGLLLNFGALTIVGGMRRIVNNFPQGTRESVENAIVLG